MEWLNYHHLRYFWTVAREGSVTRAAERLHVSAPSVSEQVHDLEDALGEKLLRRSGRGVALTEAGQVVYRYADDIFSLGREMMNALKQRPGARALRLCVGVADSFPKLVTNEILKPVFTLGQTVHVICREGKMEDLLAQLAAHRLDIVLSDEPASSSTNFRTYNHLLMESGTTFCAAGKIAAALRKGFPGSLHGAPALLPAENTVLRRSLEIWFRNMGVVPNVVAEFEDLALMKVMAAEGRGFIAVPSLAAKDAVSHYDFRVIGTTDKCKVQYHAVTAERKTAHPAVVVITGQAVDGGTKTLFGSSQRAPKTS